MNVVAINSSSRKNGNAALLIQTVFEELEAAGIKTEVVELAAKVVEPCKACWACGGRGNCIHFAEGIELMSAAQGCGRADTLRETTFPVGRRAAVGYIP